MKKLFIYFLILLSVSAYAQERTKFLYVEMADKSITLWPFYKVFGNNFDPAITLGVGFDYRKAGNRLLFQTVQLTGYSTEIIGNGVTLTTSFGYRYSHKTGIFGEGMLGIGASTFFPSRESFSQNDEGIYTQVKPLHIVAALPIDILLGYRAGRYAFYLKYRYMMIGPYTEAMPVVPVSLFGIGARYELSAKEKSL